MLWRRVGCLVGVVLVLMVEWYAIPYSFSTLRFISGLGWQLKREVELNLGKQWLNRVGLPNGHSAIHTRRRNGAYTSVNQLSERRRWKQYSYAYQFNERE